MENKQKSFKLNKKGKIAISVASVIVAIVAACAIAFAAAPTWCEATLFYAIMPHEIEAPLDAGTLKMGVTLSDNYKKNKLEKRQPFSAYNYYYYDLDGSKVEVQYMDNFKFGEEEVQPMLVFSVKAMEKLNQIKSVLIKVLIVAVIILIPVGIVLWFLNWSKREDKRLEQSRKKHNAQQRKK